MKINIIKQCKKLFFLVLLFLSISLAAANNNKSLVRLLITNQNYSFYRPWKKKQETKKIASAVYLGKGYFLTTADIIENHTFIELQKASNPVKMEAKAEFVDYQVNLALLKVKNKSFCKDLKAVKISKKFWPVKTAVSIQRLNDRREVAASPGHIYETETFSYPFALSNLIAYQVTTSLLNGGWSEAVFKKGSEQLFLGLTMYAFEKKSLAIIIPSAVIYKFLLNHHKSKISKNKKYYFPISGLFLKNLTNPVKRKFYNADSFSGGVLVTAVLKDSSMDGKIKNNDILLEVDGVKIDSEGYYIDSVLGRTSASHLFQFRKEKPLLVGSKVTCKIFRKGKIYNINIILKDYTYKKMRIQPYRFDKAPEFLIVGGLIFVELEYNYLKEWGASWRKNADKRFVYYYDYYSYNLAAKNKQTYKKIKFSKKKKSFFIPENGKILILSHVLADDALQGYEWMYDMVLKDFNGKKVKNLRQLKNLIKSSGDKFLKFEFIGGIPVVLKKSDLAGINKRVKKIHRLPSLEYLE